MKLLEGIGFGIRPDLSRIEALVDLLAHPERSYPTIHVAGTNGKSSTARMIGAILAAHGLVAGVYTSPHLQSVRERFLTAGLLREGARGVRVAQDRISPDEFAATFAYLLPFVGMVEARQEEAVTHFELSTALAFEWLADKAVQVGVFEAGLGGTWDATNVIEAQVAVITPIALDHTSFLGHTFGEQAREKAGILKQGGRAVSAPQEPEVLEELQRAAGVLRAPLVLAGRDFRLVSDRLAHRGRLISIEGCRGSYVDLFLPLHGSYQASNAAVAVAACEQFLERSLDEEALRVGLAAVESPGRLEVVGRNPLVVLDGAHNPAAAAVLGPALVETFGERRRIFVVSVFEDKDQEGILEQLMPHASKLVFTASSSPRAAPPERLAALATLRGVPCEIIPSLGAALDAAISGARPEDLVVITGSLFAVGEARDRLMGPLE
ncbi:MAG: bifunctional folylpolyglutamate synthase/dihydrofolate synthase [Actinomycetota bacterium]